MAGRGAEQQESKPIHGIDLGTWLPKQLENLSAAPDELDHACRQSRDFASHFRVSYDIFLSIMEAAKPVFSVCTHDDGGCAAEPKYTHVLSAIPQSIRILVELLSLLARQQKWYYRLQQAQSLISYNYILNLYRYVGGCTAVVVLIRQPSQNLHTFCRRFRSPYVFWSRSSPCWRDSRSATSTEFDSI